MKKNRMMRLASIVLVLVLMTSSIVGGTFAKYTTQTSVNDEARVAYWGFGKATATTFDLFDGAYDTTVNSDVNVVAPGTAKETKFAFAYTNSDEGPTAPEVAYTFVVDANITGNYDALDKNENFVWTLDGTDYQTVADLLKAIEDLDGNNDQNCYEAGTLPTGFEVGSEHTIGWNWAFDDDSTTKDAYDNAQNVADTAMGNATDLADVSITITITATQID